MRKCNVFLYLSTACLYILAFVLIPLPAQAQQNITINLAPIDGIALTPDNILNYQVHSSKSVSVLVQGTIRYRNANQSLSYSFNCNLNQGINMLSADVVHPKWQFSSSSLQELFFTYKILPEGTFQYCITITPSGVPIENTKNVFDECLYHRANDIFLINLIDPADKAKLTEFNPMLSWIANYSFSNELSYRIKVAEIKQGQNPVNAIMRNQPVYDENNLLQNSVIYPVYAKPLIANQPYAWTVSAYYKGILLGGSETWQFIIPDDTLQTKIPPTRSYIDIRRESGTAKLNVKGEMKLKYLLENFRTDVLSLQLLDENNQPVGIKPEKLNAVYGDNRYILNLRDSCSLKHEKEYKLIIETRTKEHFTLPFKYLNPDF